MACLRNELESSRIRRIPRKVRPLVQAKGANELRMIRPTRRESLIAGAAAFGKLVAGPDFSRAAECILTSTQIGGPYHINGAAHRRDVRSGRPGVDLVLRIRIVDAAGCEPVAGARTEIWACDALGNYSGHPDVDPDVPPGFGGRQVPGGSGARVGGGGMRDGHREPTGPRRFLRGAQTANDRGEVEFLTIYPGWYAPRAVHVHVKTHLGGNELLTTQLYFPDELTDAIHRTEPYSSRHPTPYRNPNDRVKYWGLDGNEPVGVYPTMTSEGNTQAGTITIGVKRA